MSRAMGEDNTRANDRPSPWLAPVPRMISLLTSNKPDMTDSAQTGAFLDTDDLSDRKPDLLTKLSDTANRQRDCRP